MRLILIIVTVILLVGIVSAVRHTPRQKQKPQETQAAASMITVEGNQRINPPFLQGFLTGVGNKPEDQLDASLITPLRPQFWRIPDFVYYDKIKAFNPKITLVLGEQYANTHGGYANAKPWEHWDTWDAFVKETYSLSIATNKPIAYWDVWGEPDINGGTPWQGSYTQLLELFSRTYRVLHELDKNVQVIGPSVSEFSPRFHEGTQEVKGLEQFISDLATKHNVRLDAVSWHELGSFPEEVPQHTEAIRKFLKAEFPNYTPEFHINEFSAESDHLIPGWTVGWLYYLEKAGISVASRACWNVKPQGAFAKSWSDCWAGLNGLLNKENKIPRHTYWAHRAYADLAQGTRIATESTTPHIIALASKNDVAQEMHLLVGRYEWRGAKKAPAIASTLTIKDYPYTAQNVSVTLKRIPNENIFKPLPEPTPTTITLPVLNKTIIIPFESFQDGDAYNITITTPTI